MFSAAKPFLRESLCHPCHHLRKPHKGAGWPAPKGEDTAPLLLLPVPPTTGKPHRAASPLRACMTLRHFSLFLLSLPLIP